MIAIAITTHCSWIAKNILHVTPRVVDTFLMKFHENKVIDPEIVDNELALFSVKSEFMVSLTLTRGAYCLLELQMNYCQWSLNEWHESTSSRNMVNMV
jgi:hypothetical protein